MTFCTASTVVIKIAMEVEQAAYKLFRNNAGGDYKAKIRSLYQNILAKSNPTLRTRVLSSEISPDRLVTMTSAELASKQQQEIDEKLKQENMRKAQVAVVEKSISDQLICGKCKAEKSVAYSQAQTRSADEPMTTFCECTKCGNRWKFS
jgi:transcription elongation factor S-II